MIHENDLPFWRRFLIYQKERFPFLAHGPLIFVFTFSAVSYSRICRGVDSFIATSDLIVGFITTICLFLLVRILDEFKDQETDRKYRQELPVPRGLMKLSELKIVGFVVVAIQIAVILLVHPSMFLFYFIVMVYLALMTVEFFVHDWLNEHLWAYAGSHMLIIPLVDIYASGLDWHLAGVEPHLGLLFFFGVSYFNGIVLEIGRKLKNPADEKEGVVTYSGLLGYKKGAITWIIILFVTAGIAVAACLYAALSVVSFYILGAAFLLGLISAMRYIKNPTSKNSKMVEIISGVWTLLMYATLGGIPGLLNFLL